MIFTFADSFFVAVYDISLPLFQFALCWPNCNVNVSTLFYHDLEVFFTFIMLMELCIDIAIYVGTFSLFSFHIHTYACLLACEMPN